MKGWVSLSGWLSMSLGLGCAVWAVTLTAPNAIAALADGDRTEAPMTPPLTPQPYAPLRTNISCPTEPEALTELLVRDIPNYTNRVLQRTVAVLPWTEADQQRQAEGLLVREPYRPAYVLVAGNVDLTPLDLADYAFTTSPEAGGPLTQVFFTTLSRQYSGLQVNEVQEYHWLFLVQTPAGWRLAFMFSAIDDVQDTRGMLPPRESSRGSVGQAVQIWLRDCRAGAIAER
ncbi:MAG: hypothetical protein AAFQ74_00605 [Cyanobacteria bacterium J06623_4]